jgi:predicted metal-dependent HD superfamily phosphohydrolase
MDLANRWAAAWEELGASPDERLFQDLSAAYREPHRHYHTLQHLEECFANFDLLRADADNPAQVELALWFHDAIYDTRRPDNEERSAHWASESIVPVSREAAEQVHRLIMATKHDAAPEDSDAKLLVDVDLSILGAADERFDQYERQIREEYAWVPTLLYRRERRRILAAFLSRPVLFRTSVFVRRYELQARRNLERALARL